MAGFTQNIFGRGKFKKNASNSISFDKYFKHCSNFYNFKLFFLPRFQYDPLWKYCVEVNYQFSNAFMTNNEKILQGLIKQQLEDEKNLNYKNIVHGPISESIDKNSLTISNISPSTTYKCPSSKKLLSRPWLIKVRTNTEGKPPILKCYAIDEKGEIIEVEGKPLLIPPILGPEAKQDIWKPKGWKPIRQTLKLHEIAPSPKCPKHQHLQKSKNYELIRETLLQATIVTTIIEEEKHSQQLLGELTRETINHRLRKLSRDYSSPNWIPPKWTMPKEKTQIKDETTKEDENSSSSESSSISTSSSSDKEGASSEAKDKQKHEEEQKKRLEEKKKKKEKKKKIRDEKQRQFRLALREAAGQAAFAGTYATRVGGLGRPF